MDRLASYIEESIRRGLTWVVFEPNREPLWAKVRASVAAFMHTLWREGALAGGRPEDAFFVRCDHTTMTQDDIKNGRLVILVGFAPLRPAEFVVLKLEIAACVDTQAPEG